MTESTRNANTEIHSSVMELLDEKIFNNHSLQDCIDDFNKMYFRTICDENVESSFERSCFTQTFLTVNHLFGSIAERKDPNDVFNIKINLKNV